jgi:N-acyl-D-aspartate/D-glutamate deacylase
MMQRLVLDAVGQGAIGMTTGLIFVPGCYAETGEIIQLAQTMRGIDNVLYASHTRSLNERIIEGNEEAAAVGEAAGIPVVLSHMCPAPPLWGAAGPVLRGIEAIRARGIDVTLDMFPYTYGANALFNMVPSWAREQGAAGLVQSLKDPSFRSRVKEDTLRYGAATGGSAKRGLIREGKWDLIWISGATRTPEYNGMSIAEIAELRGQDPYDAMLDLTIEEGPDTGIMGGDRTEEDLREILAHPLTMIGSDGRADAPGGIPDLPVHPRAYGCFPRVLSRYVRVLLPAQTMRIRDRGLLCKAQFADVVVFDPVHYRPCGHKEPEGVPVWHFSRGRKQGPGHRRRQAYRCAPGQGTQAPEPLTGGPDTTEVLSVHPFSS